jgi:hypothetical protein
VDSAALAAASAEALLIGPESDMHRQPEATHVEASAVNPSELRSVLRFAVLRRPDRRPAVSPIRGQR